MQVIVGIISIAGVFIALMMLIRDMKRENTKVLKGIADIQKDQSQILGKIEEGQRKGFAAIEEGQRKGFETLSKQLETTVQILAKVEANTRA